MKKVLLVDDEVLIRMIVKKVLGRVGYTLVEAEDGAAALRVGEEHKGTIDLLLSDMELPNVRGPEIFEQLKKDNPNMRVLFMSGFGEGEARMGSAAGQNFLPKPFTLTELENAVAKALE